MTAAEQEWHECQVRVAEGKAHFRGFAFGMILMGAISLLLSYALLPPPAKGAPVPTHLMRSAPDPIVPGYRWFYSIFELEVVRVDGEVVTYRCVSDPDNFGGSRTQTKQRVRDEARYYGTPPFRYLPLWPPDED